MSSAVALPVLLVLFTPPDRSVQNDVYHVRVEAPAGWTVLKQSAYPSVIATMTHKEGGRMTLSAQHVSAGQAVDKLAERGRAALEHDGVRVERVLPSPLGDGTVELYATSRDGKQQL